MNECICDFRFASCDLGGPRRADIRVRSKRDLQGDLELFSKAHQVRALLRTGKSARRNNGSNLRQSADTRQSQIANLKSKIT